MNINFTTEENPKVEKVEFVDNTQKRFKKADILIFVICIIGAFVIWCYANYIDDPIVVRTVTVEYVLEDGENSEYIWPRRENIEVYGEKSVVDAISNGTITIAIGKSSFKNSETIDYKIVYPEGIHSHDTNTKLTLKGSQNSTDE